MRGDTMRVLLIAPAISANLHVLSEVTDIAECTAYMPNLSLPTLAALTPPDVEVTLVDEAVESIDFDQQWDVVGITGYLNHRARMFEIADEFRRRGLLVAIGGPFVSLSPLTVRPHADVLFIGEAENTWPQFLEDFRRGTWKDEYRTVGAVDLHASPIPDIRRLKHREYYMGVVQTSRGCPFECEFCDVIVYLGRKQRHKTPERVVEELEQLYQAGYRRVFLSDDNFTAYRQKARAILGAVHEWTKDKPERLFFATQLSIDVARDTELLDLCATAGLRHVFIGIETPDEDALREVKKRQNIRPDLVA